MAGRVEGKVALITGAARGQGRSHAIRLAQEGADIIALDLCGQVESISYPMATSQDLAETVAQVEALDRRIVAAQADVRDFDALSSAVANGVAELGRLDIVCANAGVVSYGSALELTSQQWADVLDTNLTGVWHTAKAATPFLIDGGRGGSMVLTSSSAGLMAYPNTAHYSSAKHGLVGLMKVLALELAPHMIRVNSVHPGSTATDMMLNQATFDLFGPDLHKPTLDQLSDRLRDLNALPVVLLESIDISNAVLFLSSDEARYITGAALPVDAGTTLGSG